jgi:uncharacterized protein with HEPN domain
MDNQIRKYLYDIHLAMERIDDFLGDSCGFEDYQRDIMLQHAVERNLEIIGEAVSNILKKDSQIKITDARKIVDTRNKIIHGYDEIEPASIWFILVRHLPLLKEEIKGLLK